MAAPIGTVVPRGTDRVAALFAASMNALDTGAAKSVTVHIPSRPSERLLAWIEHEGFHYDCSTRTLTRVST